MANFLKSKYWLIQKFLIIFFAIIIGSCSSDETYDKSKASSIFSKENILQIDEDLASSKINLSQQIKNFSWNFYNSDNIGIENFYFESSSKESFFSKKSFLDDYKKIWSGYIGSRDFVYEPIIVDERIYALDATGNLFCFDLKNKEQIYKKRIFKRKFIKNYQNPRIGYYNKKIFAIAGTNEIKAINSVDGEIIWSKKILSLPSSTPVADDKLVFVSTSDNKTYALDSQNGSLVWVVSAVPKPTAILGSSKSIIHEEIVFAFYSSGEIYAIKKNNGDIIWSKDLNLNKAIGSDFYLNDIDSNSVIKNNILYTIGNGGLMMAIDIKTGNYLWKKEIASTSDLFLSSGFVFIIDNNNNLICLSQKNGAIKYIKKLPDYKNNKNPERKIIYNGLVIAGDKIIASDMTGRLVIINPNNGDVEESFKTNQKIFHSPIIVNGKIYLHTIGRFVVNLYEIW